MKIIYNQYLPFKGFLAINLFGIVFARKSANPISSIEINHEQIHSAQMKELGYVFFYILYILEWIIRLFGKGNAYRHISFEREAYAHQTDLSYLIKRGKWAMWTKRHEY